MTATISAAFLCDAGTVREGVGNVLGAGINVLPRVEPFVLAADLFVMFQLDSASEAFEVTVEARTTDGTILQSIGGAIEASNTPATVEAIPTLVPAVVPVRSMTFPSPGVYELHAVLSRSDQELSRRIFSFAITDATEVRLEDHL